MKYKLFTLFFYPFSLVLQMQVTMRNVLKTQKV